MDGVIFYGLVSWETNAVIEFFASRQEAESERLTILADEPDWASVLAVVPIDFGSAQPSILPS